jgi:hypothetical protein
MAVEALNFYVNAPYKLLSKSTESAEEPQKRDNYNRHVYFHQRIRIPNRSEASPKTRSAS